MTQSNKAASYRGSVRAEGDLDWRGTLAVDKEAPVGFTEIRLSFDLVSSASDEELATLQKLTERYWRIRVEEAERWGDEVLQMAPRRLGGWINVRRPELRTKLAREAGVPASHLIGAAGWPRMSRVPLNFPGDPG